MTVDLAIVGAGPAGMAAAMLAAELGLDALLVDEAEAPGGQIYRGVERAAEPSPLGKDYLAGRWLAAAFRDSRVRYRPETTVWHIDPAADPAALSIVSDGTARPSRRATSCWRPARSNVRCRSRAGRCPA